MLLKNWSNFSSICLRYSFSELTSSLFMANFSRWYALSLSDFFLLSFFSLLGYLRSSLLLTRGLRPNQSILVRFETVPANIIECIWDQIFLIISIQNLGAVWIVRRKLICSSFRTYRWIAARFFEAYGLLVFRLHVIQLWESVKEKAIIHINN